MIKKGLLVIILCCSFTPSFAKGGLLDLVISVDIKSTPVKNILVTIETKARVSFTYNPRLIDEERIVSLSIREKTIRYGLSLIFDETVRFKEVGDHIILLKNENAATAKARKKADVEFHFSGQITDKRSGRPIQFVSIYEVDEHYSAISDEQGNYTLTLPPTQVVRSFYFGLKGYHPEVLVVSGNETEVVVINVALEPINDDVSPVEYTEIRKLESSIENRAISGALVSDATFIHGENLTEIDETRWAQISLVPSVSIGSNLSTNALINNHFSLNVLAGYSKGVRGVEIGSIANFVKEDVVGAQIGGVVNLNGGDIKGCQVAGIANLIQGNVTGAQVGGISSIMKRDLIGGQVSGISSIVRGGFKGGQISGIGSIAFKKSTGAQVSGVFNVVKDSLFGGQIAGFANVSNGGTNLCQLSGFSNFANENKGIQLSGFTNFARENKGIQIGIINSSIRGNGVSIGLFNFVKEGYHKTEVSANEIFPLNLTFKTGTQRLYNTYNFGVRFGPKEAYAMGLGFGMYFNLTERLRLSTDISGQMVFENDFEQFEFAQLFKLSPTLDIRLAKWVTFFVGPSLNLNIMQFKDDDGLYSTGISFYPIEDVTQDWGRSIYWVGGQAGFRF